MLVLYRHSPGAMDESWLVHGVDFAGTPWRDTRGLPWALDSMLRLGIWSQAQNVGKACRFTCFMALKCNVDDVRMLGVQTLNLTDSGL